MSLEPRVFWMVEGHGWDARTQSATDHTKRNILGPYFTLPEAEENAKHRHAHGATGLHILECNSIGRTPYRP